MVALELTSETERCLFDELISLRHHLSDELITVYHLPVNMRVTAANVAWMLKAGVELREADFEFVFLRSAATRISSVTATV